MNKLNSDTRTCTLFSVGDGLQAIQLEDGTTAYISQSAAATVFNDGSTLEDASLRLENLQSQVCMRTNVRLCKCNTNTKCV